MTDYDYLLEICNVFTLCLGGDLSEIVLYFGAFILKMVSKGAEITF